jgi:hypothetical protein
MVSNGDSFQTHPFAAEPPSAATEDPPRLGPHDTPVKAAHAAGLAVLALSELWRADLKAASGNGTTPSGTGRLYKALVSVSDKDWHKAAVDIYDTISFGEGRAALWAAVFFALVVRLNRHGPEKLQLAISYVTAAYCVVAAITGAYFFLAGGRAIPVIALSLGVVWASTRD